MNDETAPQRPYRFIGKPLPRKEDRRLVTGKGRFTDDFNLDGQVYAGMGRSPYPHARIVAIDVAAAKNMPGVLGVFTGANGAAEGFKPIPHDPVPKTKYDMKLTGPGGGAVFAGPHVLLPADRVRHVGEAVAMVVAATKAQAMDAAEAVVARYQELPFVLHSEDAMAAGAPALWDEAANNICVDTSFGDAAATATGFPRAAHVVSRKFHVGRVTGVPLEPRVALGVYDAAIGRYTLYAGSGGAVRQKRELTTVLGIAPENLRVLSFDVGGNFGTRNRVFVEFGLVLWAAKKVGRPVKFTATRAEAFLSDYQGRDLVTEVALALDKDGRILAMRATNISNVGARCVSLSPLSKGAGLIPGSYAIPAAHLRALAVFTNTLPTPAVCGSERTGVTFACESFMPAATSRISRRSNAARSASVARFRFHSRFPASACSKISSSRRRSRAAGASATVTRAAWQFSSAAVLPAKPTGPPARSLYSTASGSNWRARWHPSLRGCYSTRSPGASPSANAGR